MMQVQEFAKQLTARGIVWVTLTEMQGNVLIVNDTAQVLVPLTEVGLMQADEFIGHHLVTTRQVTIH